MNLLSISIINYQRRNTSSRLSLLITIFIATSFVQNPYAQPFFNDNNQACCCIGNEKCGIEGRKNEQNTRTLLADVLGTIYSRRRLDRHPRGMLKLTV